LKNVEKNIDKTCSVVTALSKYLCEN